MALGNRRYQASYAGGSLAPKLLSPFNRFLGEQVICYWCQFGIQQEVPAGLEGQFGATQRRLLEEDTGSALAAERSLSANYCPACFLPQTRPGPGL